MSGYAIERITTPTNERIIAIRAYLFTFSPSARNPSITTANGVKALKTWQIMRGRVRTSRFVNTKQNADATALANSIGLVCRGTSEQIVMPKNALESKVKTKHVAFWIRQSSTRSTAWFAMSSFEVPFSATKEIAIRLVTSPSFTKDI